MRTTVFTFFHHSVQIPAGLLALFFLTKKKKKKKQTRRFAVYLPPSASGTYYCEMGAHAWIIRITAGLVEGRASWQG